MPPISLIIAELEGARVALKSLFRELGPVKALRVFAGVAAGQARGEPWRELGKPADEKETLSRRQLGSAVLLERNLRKVADAELARKLTAGIVLDASTTFLERNVPVLKKEKVMKLSDSGRKKFVEKIQENFFNADADIRIEGDEAMFLTVKRCRFVELLDAIGERDMATVFCEGDRVFFDKCQPEVIFERPETLSAGGACCDFQFRWK